jgi:magnesium-transporting ATPase (P-type)
MAKSTVVSGFGRALVVAVGYNTTAGSAAEKMGATDGEKTEL